MVFICLWISNYYMASVVSEKFTKSIMMELIDYSSHISDVIPILPLVMDRFPQKINEFLELSVMHKYVIG